jgi:hypothetical protein
MTAVRHVASWVRVGAVLTLLSIAVAAGSIAAALAGRPLGTETLLILGSFAAVIAVGEVFRIGLPGARETAPMSIAAGYALAMTLQVGDAHLNVGADVVMATTAVGMLLGALLAVARRSAPRMEDLAARFLSVSVAALLFRHVVLWDGRPLLTLQLEWDQQRWLTAISMVLVSAIALFVQSACVAISTASRDHRPLWRSFADELRQAAGLSTALATSGALIALAERPMGIVAVPVFLVPLVLTQFAVRRFAGIRETYGQTIRSLAQLTEIGGYTRPNHPSRVASLSVAMGRDLGMSERDALDLEYAALLHDIGQVALREPIPGGATMLAAPADQDRIARDGAQIVRQTGVLDHVAVILESLNGA